MSDYEHNYDLERKINVLREEIEQHKNEIDFLEDSRDKAYDRETALLDFLRKCPACAPVTIIENVIDLFIVSWENGYNSAEMERDETYFPNTGGEERDSTVRRKKCIENMTEIYKSFLETA